ncbi:hypothetical protein [Frigidibacter sp. MR17.24]|uniref:hypothetical protein n=1 Tax=Frigidibacter sp. MR17.24 TaxID=3127345 RepID=UPI003012CEAC
MREPCADKIAAISSLSAAEIPAWEAMLDPAKPYGRAPLPGERFALDQRRAALGLPRPPKPHHP